MRTLATISFSIVSFRLITHYGRRASLELFSFNNSSSSLSSQDSDLMTDSATIASNPDITDEVTIPFNSDVADTSQFPPNIVQCVDVSDIRQPCLAQAKISPMSKFFHFSQNMIMPFIRSVLHKGSSYDDCCESSQSSYSAIESNLDVEAFAALFASPPTQEKVNDFARLNLWMSNFSMESWKTIHCVSTFIIGSSSITRKIISWYLDTMPVTFPSFVVICFVVTRLVEFEPRASPQSQRTRGHVSRINIPRRQENAIDTPLRRNKATQIQPGRDNTTDITRRRENTTDTSLRHEEVTDITRERKNTTDATLRPEKVTDITLEQENTTDTSLRQEKVTDITRDQENARVTSELSSNRKVDAEKSDVKKSQISDQFPRRTVFEKDLDLNSLQMLKKTEANTIFSSSAYEAKDYILAKKDESSLEDVDDLWYKTMYLLYLNSSSSEVRSLTKEHINMMGI